MDGWRVASDEYGLVRERFLSAPTTRKRDLSREWGLQEYKGMKFELTGTGWPFGCC